MDNLQPLRQFTWRLLILLGVGAILLLTVASELVDRAFVGDTARATQAAVESHFATIFPAALLTMGGQDSSQPAAGSGYGGSAMAGMPGMGNMSLDGLVRLHFNLYNIVHASFYDPMGEVTYSYKPDLIGTRATGDKMKQVQAAVAGSTGLIEEAWGSARVPTVHLFVPIHARSGNAIIGVAEVVRDMTPVRANIRHIQLATSSLIVALAVALFFSLRRVYATSTDAIRSRSEALARALREVQQTYDATLRALSSALDTRDSETEDHSLRVTAYADHLAGQLGLSDGEREALRRGALLHDLGKIGIPDAVLRKPGPLNDAEWQQMRRHPEIGAQMLQDINFLASAVPVVRHHHERWDGKGYPDHLAGAQIPMAARIFAVADTLDAMTADRPYRSARPFAEARAEIAKNAGAQFDPRVVEAFLATPEAEWAAIARMVREVRHQPQSA